MSMESYLATYVGRRIGCRDCDDTIWQYGETVTHGERVEQLLASRRHQEKKHDRVFEPVTILTGFSELLETDPMKGATSGA